jgi:NodT family efflux transporter outer membrane factor (OMF) lipoprotein
MHLPRSLRRGAVAAAAALLAACTVGPDFQRPAAPADTAYTGEPLDHLGQAGGQRTRAGTDPAAGWWSGFGSPELDATMRQALAGNRSLAAAQARLAQARQTVSAAGGALYPQVSGNLGAGREKYGAQFAGPQTIPPFTYFSVGPSVGYVLDYNGGQRRAIEQQQALAEVQAQQAQAAYLAVSGNVVQQALSIAALRAQIAAVEQLLEEDRKNASLTQTAFDTGTVSRIDLLSAQSQLANDQTLLPPLRQQLSLARHALAILAGETPAAWSAPDFELERLQLPQDLPLSLPSELAHRRPDILAAEARVHAAVANVGVATARLYPQLTLTASMSQESTQLSHLFEKSANAWGLAAGLTGPIFDGGTLRAERRGAEAAAQAAVADYEQAVLDAFGQVADVLTALDHDAEQLAAQQKALDTAAANLELTRQSYQVGNSGVLQVLDAERLHQQARLGYVRAQAQRYQDTAQLYLALGGASPLAPVALAVAP